MASAMRLKRDLGPGTAAAESKFECYKPNLQDDNSNGPNFNDCSTWGAFRPNHGTPKQGLNVVLTNRHNLDAAVDNSRHLPPHHGPRPPSPHPYTCNGNSRIGLDIGLELDETGCGSPAGSECGSGYTLSESEPPSPGGILQHLAAKLLRLAAGSDGEDEEEEENNNNKKHNNINCNNNNYNVQHNINSVRHEQTGGGVDYDSKIDSVNRLVSFEDSKKALYDKPKLAAAMSDAFLSSAKEELSLGREFTVKQPPHPLAMKQCPRLPRKDSNRAHEEMNEVEKFSREVTEKGRGRDECIVPRKKEKMALNHHARKHMDRRAAAGPGCGGAGAAGGGGGALKKRSSLEVLGGFDVYNMETAMPRIDLDLIESHLRAAKEEERRMFENILSNLKSKSAKMTGSLSIDNLKEHTNRFAESIDVLKSRMQLQSSRVSSYILAQRSSSVNVDPIRPTDSYVHLEDVVDPQMNRWLPPVPVDEEDSIVDRFIRVITIEDEDDGCQIQMSPPVRHKRRRRNDREEIRRRLAMGSEDADYYTSDQRPGKKPSLQARLQSGMNLQICFMNETLSDTESPGSESEHSSNIGASASIPNVSTPAVESPPERFQALCNSPKPSRPLSLPLRLDANQEWRQHSSLMTEADFLARQAQLQAEARMALAQAKDMAHMQMEIERQRQNASPITEMVRRTLHKVGVSFPEDRRRLSRQILTEMNVAQLQVIVNDLHTQIEYLNESLVRYLMERDDLHMEQDSMLVDIEDLTRYLGAKEQCVKTGTNHKNISSHSNGLGNAGRLALKK